jgi:hypothetical protein
MDPQEADPPARQRGGEPPDVERFRPSADGAYALPVTSAERAREASEEPMAGSARPERTQAGKTSPVT